MAVWFALTGLKGLSTLSLDWDNEEFIDPATVSEHTENVDSPSRKLAKFMGCPEQGDLRNFPTIYVHKDKTLYIRHRNNDYPGCGVILISTDGYEPHAIGFHTPYSRPVRTMK